MAILDAASPQPGGSSILGVPMKPLTLITLTFQNSALILVMHYSRMMEPTGDHRYFASTAVLLNEVLKLAISLTFALYEASRTLAPSTPATVLLEQIRRSVLGGDGWKLAFPATLYTLQNYLLYVAVSNLNPVNFQILYQLKILTTAIFTVLLLRRPLPAQKWLALILLTVGISIVSLPQAGRTLSDDAHLLFHDTTHPFPRSVHELGQLANGAAEVAHQFAKRSATYEGIQDEEIDPLLAQSAPGGLGLDGADGLLPEGGGPAMSYPMGLAAALVAATISGLNGVYFEKVLKHSPTPVSVWTRNVQLALFSLVIALVGGVWIKDGAGIAEHGFFDGWSPVVWVAVACHAVTGLLTSLAINYADNIAKNFATSISIVVSFGFSLWFFDFKVTPTFLLGTAIVLASVYVYSTPEPKFTRPPPIRVASFREAKVDRMSTPRLPGDQKQQQTAHLSSLDSLKSAGLSTSRPSSPMTRKSTSKSRSWDE